jgi:hypothetical protein
LREKGIDASVREGTKSQYDVLADGELVFSKQSEGRWPDDGEVLGLLQSR